jgi:hypothetical protein
MAELEGDLPLQGIWGAKTHARLALKISVVIALAALIAGCDQLGLGSKAAEPDGAPAEQELQRISYMSSANSGPNGRRLYSHFEEAKTCGDFELAMRWNRPPGSEGGPFHKKMVYLSANIPADLPKESEVFVVAKIERGQTLPSGSAGWSLRMNDGTVLQAVESAQYWEKEEQDSQQGKIVALVDPNKPGRAFCAHAVYQGLLGKDPDQDKKIPLISVLFAMDRRK